MQLYNKTNLESLQLPNDFESVSTQELKKSTGIGRGYNGYRFWNGSTSGLVVCSEGKKAGMPFSEQELTKLLHESMDENEGIIEVKEGVTEKGLNYIYRLVKTRREAEPDSPMTVAYQMQMCIAKNGRHLYVDSMIIEEGVTGLRDSIGFATFRNENPDKKLDELMELWTKDPYDPEYKNGFLMNRSEVREMDEQFPHHPLSIARKLADGIITLN